MLAIKTIERSRFRVRGSGPRALSVMALLATVRGAEVTSASPFRYVAVVSEATAADASWHSADHTLAARYASEVLTNGDGAFPQALRGALSEWRSPMSALSLNANLSSVSLGKDS